MQWRPPYGDRLHSPRGQYAHVGVYRAGNVYLARNETRRFAGAWATARLALDICLRSKLGLTWAKGTSFTPIVEFINSLGP